MSADGGRQLITFRTLAAALCIALMAMWAALGQPASAGILASPSALEADAIVDHHDGHHEDLSHTHNGLSDFVNFLLGVGHIHDLDSPDGHHHHPSADTVTVLASQQSAENQLMDGLPVRWAIGDPRLSGRSGDQAEDPPRR